MLTKIETLFDTTHYTDEYELGEHFIVEEDLEYIIEERFYKTRGNVVGWALLSERSSHYGSISNNGALGYNIVNTDNLVNTILYSTQNSHTVTVTNNKGIVNVHFHDHDGTHHCELKPIAKSREERIDNLLDFGEHEEIIDYLKEMPSLRVKKNI